MIVFCAYLNIYLPIIATVIIYLFVFFFLKISSSYYCTLKTYCKIDELNQKSYINKISFMTIDKH